MQNTSDVAKETIFKANDFAMGVQPAPWETLENIYNLNKFETLK